jgi:hypothetical protein
VRDRSVLDLLLIHFDHARGNRTRVHESVMGNRCDRVSHVLVRVRDSSYVGGVVVDNRRVVNIRDLRDAHAGVGDIHIVHIAWASSIPRHEDFTRSQREPGHANPDAKANSDAESTAAHEGD